MRLDFEDPAPIDDAAANEILKQFKAVVGDVDVVCIEDYNKGLLTPAITTQLIALARAANVPVIIDPANQKCLLPIVSPRGFHRRAHLGINRKASPTRESRSVGAC